ncbi:MAG: pitrilysin family protein [Pseudomonadota bacterium]|nr:pitrilysin family protein [Pseudomonadota bacterium]
MKKSAILLAAMSGVLLFGCAREATAPAPAAGEKLVAFEKFELDNGLSVIFSIDRSDPVVAVTLTAHVGSAREKPGRTGFAHLFEHLLFLESENLGPGGLDKLSARIGGSGANGSTSRDRTNYLQTVPNDALEKMLWAEADKLGWFINTVTEPVLAKEKQVVKNEKRQSVDNQPYGHEQYVIDRALYPEGHPYSWQVIGSLEDLDAATLDDVKQFYRQWYTPNNVTLTVAGDFDAAQAKAWVEKYFGEIPRGPEIAPQRPDPFALPETRRLYHEDNFAELPQLTLAWPGAAQYTDDYYALAVLAGLLTDGKTAPLNEVLIDEKQLTGAVAMGGYDGELAGEILLQAQAFDGVDLDDVKAALDEGFARFEANGVAEKDLARIKTKLEVGFYGAVGTVLGKAVNLGEYDAVYGDPGIINEEIPSLRAVTAADVMRVYNDYIKDKPYVATSFVPKGEAALALEGSARAEVVEEPIVQGAEEAFDTSAKATYEKTPSSFDRSVEPPYGPKPQVKTPAIREFALADGLKVYAVEDRELPLVQFQLSIDGGQLLESPDRQGAANLLAEILDKGTAKKTVAEFEEAVALLGATIAVGAGDERFVISGQTLARNFAPTMDLVREMLLEPRWDEGELALAKARVTSELQASRASPFELSARAYALVSWGAGHPFARDVRGTEQSVAAMSMDDLKAYHGRALAPGNASLRVVGAASEADIKKATAGLAKGWTTPAPAVPDILPAPAPGESAVYFVDMPGAKQSILQFGRPGPLRADPDFYPASVMNYILGGGGFASRLTQELREGKGYTYGIRSAFSGSGRAGDFRVQSGVRSNVTLEAATLIRDILRDYGATFTEEDLEVTKSFLLKSQARAFESLGAKLAMLGDIADYGLPRDYAARQAAVVEGMTVDKIRALAGEYVTPDAMNYVVVGDAATQAKRLKALGYGAPVMLDMAVP